MPMFVQPTLWELMTTADATVSALDKLGYKCCFFGGFACRLFGSQRMPEDIDVVVLDANADQDAIKRQLTHQDSRFYLVNPKTYGATYKVLWFRLRASAGRSIKVDVLRPGLIDIPNLSLENVVQRHLDVPSVASRYSLSTSAAAREYPVMPLSLTLLLKLVGWEDHQRSALTYMRRKAGNDERDIDDLLPVAIGMGIKVSEDEFIPEEFMRTALVNVVKYVRQNPPSAPQWKALGLSKI